MGGTARGHSQRLLGRGRGVAINASAAEGGARRPGPRCLRPGGPLGRAGAPRVLDAAGRLVDAVASSMLHGEPAEGWGGRRGGATVSRGPHRASSGGMFVGDEEVPEGPLVGHGGGERQSTVGGERLRKFFAEAFSSQDDCPIGYEHVTTSVDAVLGSCGFRVEQQVVPFRTSRVALVAERSLRTQNVRRLALDAGQFDTVDGLHSGQLDLPPRPAWVPCERGRGPGPPARCGGGKVRISRCI